MSALPKTAFINPAGHNRAEIEALLHQVMALLTEEMTQANARSPLPDPIATGQFEQWAQIPEQSVDSDVLLGWVRSQLQASMNAAHPGYIGHMDSIPTTLSIVGDLLVAALNNNMLSVEMSPVFSRLERLVMQQIAGLFGLGSSAGGVMASGGSLANLQALTVARNVAFDAVDSGIVGLKGQPVFFVSEVAHTSMQKAAMMMGLGANSAIPLQTNANSQIEIEDLKAKLAQSSRLGQLPFAVVATAGTTVTGSIDPIEQIAAIAHSHRLWLHVDAAYGGALAFSPDHCHLLSGISQANSVTFNPQKWLYVAKTCAVVLFKQFDLLDRYFRISAPYMGEDSEWPNLGELTVQGTRHPDILKLWLSLQHLGAAGYAEIIGHNYKITAQFVEAVKARPFLELASEPQMNLVCFRLAPRDVNGEKCDRLNRQMQSYLLNGHVAYFDKSSKCDKDFCDKDLERDAAPVFLSLPTYRNRRWLKAVLLNPYTQHSTIEKLFVAIDEFVQAQGFS
ncbi:MAG: aminotransferase class V-fold PLP-dependent enzyme [Phormidesmis sp.]